MTADRPVPPAAGAPLDEATRPEGADGHYTARLSPDWTIWGPNGGYLATVALRAAGRYAQVPHPAAVHATFLSSPRCDEVDIEVVALKRGRRAETFAVTMRQDGKPVLAATVRTAAPAPGFDEQPAPPPKVSGPDEADVRQWDGRFPFWAHFDRRFAGDDQEGRLLEWLRLRPRATFDDPFLDAARSLILIDTYGWPTVWHRNGDGPFVAPNFDIGVWFYPAPEPTEWLLVDSDYEVGRLGRLAVSGRVWDAAGRLVATGAGQLCCLPTP